MFRSTGIYYSYPLFSEKIDGLAVEWGILIRTPVLKFRINELSGTRLYLDSDGLKATGTAFPVPSR